MFLPHVAFTSLYAVHLISTEVLTNLYCSVSIVPGTLAVSSEN
jgi:hypothetical protein